MPWRLLLDNAADGYTNMAIDEAILEAHLAGESPPTVRFYRWRPACLSIGYFQRAAREVDEEGCRRLGVDWVRRPTGGRGILHDVELTYSVVASVDDTTVEGGILESYRKISAGLVAGLRRIGVPAEMAPEKTRAHGAGSAACFDAPSAYEVTIHGRKVIGSAQVRRGGALLQHGAILLEADVARQAGVLQPPPGMTTAQLAAMLAPRLISLSAAAGRPVTAAELAVALRAGFEEAWGLPLEESTLTAGEQERVHALREKYASAEWNHRR